MELILLKTSLHLFYNRTLTYQRNPALPLLRKNVSAHCGVAETTSDLTFLNLPQATIPTTPWSPCIMVPLTQCPENHVSSTLEEMQATLELLRRKNQALQQEMNTINNETVQQTVLVLEAENSQPLTPAIMNVVVPENFKSPNLEHYDGQTDLKVHFATFKTHTMIIGVFETLKCNLFLGTPLIGGL